jgi:carbonic anhydrase
MEYAIDSLKVKHIIVVGHYGCGGVRAAMENLRIGIAENWLRHVQDVRNAHREWLFSLPEGPIRLDALCELNVLAQSLNVCQSTMVQDAWARGQEVTVHGWVYGLHNGLINDLRLSVANADALADAHAEALTRLRERYDARATKQV